MNLQDILERVHSEHNSTDIRLTLTNRETVSFLAAQGRPLGFCPGEVIVEEDSSGILLTCFPANDSGNEIAAN